MTQKNTYKIILLRTFNNTIYVEKTLKYKFLPKIIKIANGKTFNVLVNNPAFIEGKEKVYLIDFDTGNTKSFSEIKVKMNPEDLDTIVSTKIIKELTSGIVDNKKEKIIWILVGFLIGVFLASTICLMIMNQKIEDLLINEIPPIFSSMNSLGRRLCLI